MLRMVCLWTVYLEDSLAGYWIHGTYLFPLNVLWVLPQSHLAFGITVEKAEASLLFILFPLCDWCVHLCGCPDNSFSNKSSDFPRIDGLGVDPSGDCPCPFSVPMKYFGEVFLIFIFNIFKIFVLLSCFSFPF